MTLPAFERGRIERLIVDDGSQNPLWGFPRIRGALMSLGNEVGRNMVKRAVASDEINDLGLAR